MGTLGPLDRGSSDCFKVYRTESVMGGEPLQLCPIAQDQAL